MKKLLFIAAFIFGGFLFTNAQDKETFNLTIEISGMRSDIGKVYIALYNSEQNFLKSSKDTKGTSAIVSNKKVVSVSIPTKRDCLFDGVNFICEFETGIGNQEYSIELTYEDDSTTIIEEPPIVIVRPGENPLEFEVTLESGVSQFGESYYFFDDEIIVLASLNSDASLSYFIIC